MGDGTPTTVVKRPLGRPQRLPYDPTPLAEPTVDATRRTAWLLATTRLVSPATRDVSRSEFIRMVNARGSQLDATRISRLESGTQPASPRLLEAYESVARVPHGSLQAASALLRRTAGLTRTTEPVTPESTAALDALFDRIERREASGADWMRLASDLAGYERVYVHPTTWSTLCNQLVSELTRASGMAFVQRYEAAAGLMAHEQGRRFLSLSVGRFVMHPDAQSVAPALGLLREVSDDHAGDLVLRLMGGSNRLLRRGATEVAGAMAARGAFPDGSDGKLEQLAGRELGKAGAITRRIEAIDLATRLPQDSYDRVLTTINDARVHRRVSRARTSMELVAAEVARSYAEGIATYAEASVRRAAHDPDQMLRRLLREALFHATRERRNLAAVLLAVSPYARPVAEAVLKVATDDELVSAMAWSLLRRLGHVLEPDQIAAAALGEHRPELRPRALVTLGLSQGELTDPVADVLVATVLDPTSNALRHAAIYALGMSGHDHLEKLAHHESDEVSRAARWWLSVGPSLHDLPLAPI